MRLSEIVPEGAVIARLNATERESVIRELIEALVAAGAADAQFREELIARVLDREKRGSTGFGKGVAVPHVKHPSLKRMAAAVGLSGPGVEFASLDRQPVFTVFLLLSPEAQPEQHLQAMNVIFSNLSKETFRRFLRQAGSIEEVRSLLEEADGAGNL